MLSAFPEISIKYSQHKHSVRVSSQLCSHSHSGCVYRCHRYLNLFSPFLLIFFFSIFLLLLWGGRWWELAGAGWSWWKRSGGKQLVKHFTKEFTSSGIVLKIRRKLVMCIQSQLNKTQVDNLYTLTSDNGNPFNVF